MSERVRESEREKVSECVCVRERERERERDRETERQREREFVPVLVPFLGLMHISAIMCIIIVPGNYLP